MDNMQLYVAQAVATCFDNDNDAFIPELWAEAGLAILEENMVAASMVHRDFQNRISNFGDIVNTRRPGEFKINRKTDSDTLTQQDAVATNVQVPLDQWFYTSFTIKDGEASYSFQDLVSQYLLPGMQSIARGIDRAVVGRMGHAFLTNKVGKLEGLTAATSHDDVLDARETLNINKAYPNNRNLILHPRAETSLLKNEMFIKADERGDGGEALENARLGRILGFDTFMGQNTPGLNLNLDTVAGTVTNAAAAGTTGSQTVSISGHEVVAGEYCVVEGDHQPTYATASTASTNTTAVTLSDALKYATEAGAVITVYTACAVDGGYAAGYSKAITLDGYTTGKAPQVGQLISFNTGASRRTYTVIEATDSGSSCTVVLDRPLEVALSNDDAAFPGPAGSLNPAFHRDSFALVTRPLALPNERMGAMSAVAAYNDVAMRVTMQYSINAGGTIVNLDILGGTAVLDTNLG
ncbi:MAG: hypothetical protein KDA84_24440, partial [Planctomycetaceae bacterium]|nr:hypothetical protein [Planctomycetaceae bacterium]